MPIRSCLSERAYPIVPIRKHACLAARQRLRRSRCYRTYSIAPIQKQASQRCSPALAKMTLPSCMHTLLASTCEDGVTIVPLARSMCVLTTRQCLWNMAYYQLSFFKLFTVPPPCTCISTQTTCFFNLQHTIEQLKKVRVQIRTKRSRRCSTVYCVTCQQSSLLIRSECLKSSIEGARLLKWHVPVAESEQEYSQ